MAEWVTLYHRLPPLGDNILISVDPFQVRELVPTDYKIDWVVRMLRSNRSRGPSVMNSEHLQGWLREASKAEGAA